MPRSRPSSPLAAGPQSSSSSLKVPSRSSHSFGASLSVPDGAARGIHSRKHSKNNPGRDPKMLPNASLDRLAGQPVPGKSGTIGTDHIVSHWHGLNPKAYPSDCDPPTVHWFHAVDVPKRKPFNNVAPPSDKPAPTAKKYLPFSDQDSAALEAAFQNLADEQERLISTSKTLPAPSEEVRVSVNEDYLFDVDVQTRELAPAYWLGPTYDVRRGTWFTLEGSSMRPVEESLAIQLEEGYLRMKPWQTTKPTSSKESYLLSGKSRPQSRKGEDPRSGAGSTPDLALDTPSAAGGAPGSATAAASTDQTPQTTQLFGEYANLLVAYQDDKTAWVTTNDFISRMGGFLTGYKVFRGYKPSSSNSSKTESKSKSASSTTPPPGAGIRSGEEGETKVIDIDSLTPTQIRFEAIQRQIASLHANEKTEEEEETIRQQDENEIIDDYQKQTSEERGRQIDHLVLVTHGIGQRLGLRLDRINFVHDVNTLRKTLKAVYSDSGDLQALNDELEMDTKNSRVQVLPICWRHLLDFPRNNLRDREREAKAKGGREHDLGDAPADAIDDLEEAIADDESFPNLDDITIDGILPFRNFLTDLGLDVLLYQSEQYRTEIARIVAQECSRVYNLFMARNPAFKGKVSLLGHSLGSAIMFDILCAQPEPAVGTLPSGLGSRARAVSGNRRQRVRQAQSTDNQLLLDFEIEHFFSLGSPTGLFHLLKGHKVAGRPQRRMRYCPNPDDPDVPFVQDVAAVNNDIGTPLDFSLADLDCPPDDELKARDLFTWNGFTRPKLSGDMYNIFYPSDPIAYRIEPLVSPAMSQLRPQPLPYTKKGLFSSNGAAGQGLTSLGARVGQSVSGLWSSVSSGIANSLLNRHLGIDNSRATVPSSMTPPTSNGVNGDGEADGADLANSGVPPSVNPKLETLYASFRKKGQATTASSFLSSILTAGTGSSEPSEAVGAAAGRDREGRRLQREEAKVRGLNRNGRLDFAIQEGTFDISFTFLSSLASHLLYWADEDVSHFMIGQLLTQGGRLKRRAGSPTSGVGVGGKEGLDRPATSPTVRAGRKPMSRSNSASQAQTSRASQKKAVISFPSAAAMDGPPGLKTATHLRRSRAGSSASVQSSVSHKRLYSGDHEL